MTLILINLKMILNLHEMHLIMKCLNTGGKSYLTSGMNSFQTLLGDLIMLTSIFMNHEDTGVGPAMDPALLLEWKVLKGLKDTMELSSML